MNDSPTPLLTAEDRRSRLTAVQHEAARLLDSGLIPGTTHPRVQRHRPGDRLSYSVNGLRVGATALETGLVRVVLVDTRDINAMPLVIEDIGNIDAAARLVGLLVGAIMAPEPMWTALDRAAGIPRNRVTTNLPELVGDGLPVAWTDDVWPVVEHVTGPLTRRADTGVVARTIRQAQLTFPDGMNTPDQ